MSGGITFYEDQQNRGIVCVLSVQETESLDSHPVENQLSRSVVETLIAVRFTIVGLLATAIHLSIALVLVSIGLNPLLANATAFCFAFLFSFFGHFNWTFKKRQGYGQSFFMFLLVSLSSIFLSTVVLGALIEYSSLDTSWAVVLSVTIIPLINYLASRFWAFKGE
jgi:putative flippase GtrA